MRRLNNKMRKVCWFATWSFTCLLTRSQIEDVVSGHLVGRALGIKTRHSLALYSLRNVTGIRWRYQVYCIFLEEVYDTSWYMAGLSRTRVKCSKNQYYSADRILDLSNPEAWYKQFWKTNLKERIPDVVVFGGTQDVKEPGETICPGGKHETIWRKQLANTMWLVTRDFFFCRRWKRIENCGISNIVTPCASSEDQMNSRSESHMSWSPRLDISH